MVEITCADQSRLHVVASVLGRAFVTEPLMSWPLGSGEDLERRCIQAFEYFLEDLVDLGAVWEAGKGLGAGVWIPADALDAWEAAQTQDAKVYALTDDGGRRFSELWAWVASMTPSQLWLLDSIGVAPEMQGRGIGKALMEHGLERARETGRGVFLETATPANAAFYERLGFRVVEDADAPGGGPHVWFMRWDP